MALKNAPVKPRKKKKIVKNQDRSNSKRDKAAAAPHSQVHPALMLSVYSQQAHTYHTNQHRQSAHVNTDSMKGLILLPSGTDASPPAAGIMDTLVSALWSHSCVWHILSLSPASTVTATQVQGPYDSPGSPFL